MKKVLLIVFLISIILANWFMLSVPVNREGKVLAEELNNSLNSNKKTFSFLFIGMDKPRKNMARSDTIMLMNFNFTSNELTIVSIPRDTWVPVTTEEWSKINAAFAKGYRYGGITMAVAVINDALRRIFSVLPDKWVVLDVNGLIDLIDYIGGVKVYVEEDMDYDDNAQDLHIHLKKGEHILNGKEAMGFVRYRDKREGDLGRIRRQQYFLKQFIKTLMQPKNFFRIPMIVQKALSVIHTNMKASQIYYLLSQIKDYKSIKIKGYKLPGIAGIYKKQSIYLIDPDKAVKVIRRIEKNATCSIDFREDLLYFKSKIKPY